jgi:hypothetical protein
MSSFVFKCAQTEYAMRARIHPQFGPTTRGVLTTSGLETFWGVRQVCTEMPALRRKDLNHSQTPSGAPTVVIPNFPGFLRSEGSAQLVTCSFAGISNRILKSLTHIIRES